MHALKRFATAGLGLWTGQEWRRKAVAEEAKAAAVTFVRKPHLSQWMS